MRASAGKDPTFLLAVICLLLIPFYSLGVANDFAMRVSIPSLAFLAANFAVVLTDNIAERRQLALTSFAGLILLIGSVTGAMEVRRALIRSPLPISKCNFVEAWKQSPFAAMSMASCLGDLNALPEWMRPQSPAGRNDPLLLTVTATTGPNSAARRARRGSAPKTPYISILAYRPRRCPFSSRRR
jgi:hypothetical protein